MYYLEFVCESQKVPARCHGDLQVDVGQQMRSLGPVSPLYVWPPSRHHSTALPPFRTLPVTSLAIQFLQWSVLTDRFICGEATLLFFFSHVISS